jgi:hypothetical protein
MNGVPDIRFWGWTPESVAAAGILLIRLLQSHTYCAFRMVCITNNYGIRRMIGFINTSVTHALLITIGYKQHSSIVDLHFTIHHC